MHLEQYELDLIEEAKEYATDEFYDFVADVGWEDWMCDFTEAQDGEPITEEEAEEIDKVLKKLFDIAHKEEIRVYGK